MVDMVSGSFGKEGGEGDFFARASSRVVAEKALLEKSHPNPALPVRVQPEDFGEWRDPIARIRRFNPHRSFGIRR